MSQTLTDMEILVLYNECDEQDRADGVPVVNPGLVRKALADLEESRKTIKVVTDATNALAARTARVEADLGEARTARDQLRDALKVMDSNLATWIKDPPPPLIVVLSAKSIVEHALAATEEKA